MQFWFQIGLIGLNLKFLRIFSFMQIFRKSLKINKILIILQLCIPSSLKYRIYCATKTQNRRSLKTFPIDIRVKIDFYSDNFSISFRKNIWTWAKNLWIKIRRKLLLTQRFGVLFFKFKIYWKQQQDTQFTKLNFKK